MIALRENDVDFKHIVWEEVEPIKEGESNDNHKEIQLRRVVRG